MEHGLELRRSIALALGLAPLVVACSGRQLVAEGGEDGSDGGTMDTGEDDGAETSTTGPVGTSGTTTVGTTTVGSTTTTGTTTSTTDPTASTTTSTDTGTEQCPAPADALDWYGCVPPSPGGTCGECDAACQEALGAEYNGACGCSCWYTVAEVMCGPDAGEGECCYLVRMFEEWCGEGRPYVCGGRAITAEASMRSDWEVVLDDVAFIGDAAARRALADAWLASALAEHASVASFARFVLDLLALGAPPELVADAQQAMGEEIEHARLCFALARRYSGTAVGPGPLSASDEPRTPADIVRAAVLEGCIGETVSATEVAIAHDRATDPVVRMVLGRIAADEQRHAVLAWRFVRWAVAARPELAAVAHEAFATGLSRAVKPAGEPGDPLHVAHGRLGAAERAAIANDVRARVVAPCAAALHQRTVSATSTFVPSGRSMLATTVRLPRPSRALATTSSSARTVP